MTDSEFRMRIEANGRRAGKSARISEARAQFDKEQEVLGVLTGQVPVRSMPITTERCGSKEGAPCPRCGRDGG